MSQATEQTADHLRPSEIEWELFHDPHGRPTTPVRMLKTDGPAFLETKFTPWFSAPAAGSELPTPGVLGGG